jgi:hypothetical protein
MYAIHMPERRIQACRRCNNVAIINGAAWLETLTSYGAPISRVRFIFSGFFCAYGSDGNPESLIDASVKNYILDLLKREEINSASRKDPYFVYLPENRQKLPCHGYPVEPSDFCGEFQFRDNGFKRLSLRFSPYGPVTVRS